VLYDDFVGMDWAVTEQDAMGEVDLGLAFAPLEGDRYFRGAFYVGVDCWM
jgi:hypothetical protein